MGTPNLCCTRRNFWFYGGNGYGLTNEGLLSDLWKYDITTNEWTWIKGTDTANYTGSFGIMGVENSTNNPPGTAEINTMWTDKNNNIWIWATGQSDYSAMF